jgi:type IV pilus assembly protein PilW
MKRARTQSGLSLIELLVALAIGSVLIVGAVYVYSRGRNIYTVNESVARVQENGRFVLSVIEPDVELAGYYGFTNLADTVRFVDGDNPGTVYAVAAAMRQQPIPAAPPVEVANLPAGAHDCGTNFAVDVLIPVQGSNDSFALGPGPAVSCNAFGAGAVATADTLTARRVSTQPTAPQAGRIQIYASRLRSRSAQQMFVDGNAPGPIDADNDVYDLVVRSYYLSQDSVDRPGVPALRVKTLSEVGGAAQFVDTEVMPGVEDLQVQFGIDTGDYDNDGVLDPGADINGDGIPESDGRATRYVNPDFAGLDRTQVVSVRVWVRVRADQPEQGFVDNRTYEYANVRYTPAGADANFRRVLMSRTISLRNARTL